MWDSALDIASRVAFTLIFPAVMTAANRAACPACRIVGFAQGWRKLWRRNADQKRTPK